MRHQTLTAAAASLLAFLFCGLLAVGIPASASAEVAAEGQFPGNVAAARNHGYILPVPAPMGVQATVWRRFDPPPKNWNSGHRGVDLRAAPGSVVVSPAAGVITTARKVGGKPVVVVSHADGLRSTFEPLNALVREGSSVGAGTPIGTIADWPASVASHCPELGAPTACVHWGVLRGTVYLDPLALLGAAPPIVLLPIS